MRKAYSYSHLSVPKTSSVLEKRRIPVVLSGTLSKRPPSPRSSLNWDGLSLAGDSKERLRLSTARLREHENGKRTIYPSTDHHPEPLRAPKAYHQKERSGSITALFSKGEGDKQLSVRKGVMHGGRMRSFNVSSSDNMLVPGQLYTSKPWKSRTASGQINRIPGFGNETLNRYFKDFF